MPIIFFTAHTEVVQEVNAVERLAMASAPPAPMECGEWGYCSNNLADPQLILTGYCVLSSLLLFRKYIKFKSFPLG